MRLLSSSVAEKGNIVICYYFFSCRLLVLVLQTRAITMEFANPQIALLLVLLANVLVVIQALRVR